MTERNTNPNDLSGYVAKWLADHSMAQLRLARHAGVPHATINGLINHGFIPRPSTLRKLADAMGLPVGQLLVLAGHITEEEYTTPIGPTDLARLYDISDLSDEEWDQVRDFARYVRGKRSER